MALSRFSSFRGRPNPGQRIQHMPSFDSTITTNPDADLQLVALPYEKTIQAEPPIRIPPPRNPARLSRRPSTRPHSPQPPPPPPPPPPAPTDCSKSTSRLATIPSNATIVVPPPLPSVDHTPWHSQSASISTVCTTDWKRDSAWGTVSSAATTVSTAASTTLQEDSDQQQFTVGPTSTSSGPPTAAHVPRYSCQSRWSLSESDLSDSDTEDRDETTTRRLIRGLSLRLAPPMKRTKKHQQSRSGDTTIAVTTAPAAVAPTAPESNSEHPSSRPPSSYSESRHSRESQSSLPPPLPQLQHHLQGSPAAPQLSTSPNFPPAEGPANPEGRLIQSQSPIDYDSGPLSDANLSSSISAPTINTDIPGGSFLDDDVLDSINFSNRGSVYFGGKRAISAPIPVVSPASMESFSDPRAAPPAPSCASDGAIDANPSASDAQPSHAKNLSPPDIRVMSVDTERESQKVRSLYESGDLINWQDGDPMRQTAEPLESPVELASDGEDNIATTTGREHRKSVRALYLCPTSPLSVTSLPPPRGSTRRNDFELAGGIEDWEDIHGEDVDRYGFITVGNPRPVSHHSIPAETRSLHTTPPGQRRNGRNVLTKRHRGPPLSSGLSRIPSRKVSARSLHTQASAVSVASRISVRSGIRTAANILPHNRDRRIIDAAGDMLSLPPGLAGAEDEQKSTQAIKAAQDREARRTEKWRKMAKIVTKVKDGKGAEFDIHTMSKKEKKEMSTDGKHFQIQGMNIEFDTKSPKLVERTWKGIPDRWRAAAWYYFLSASEKGSQIDVTEDQLFLEFHRLQEMSSPDDVQIDLDVPRTINRHIMFRKRYRGGQRLLFRVLHALSLYFPETGYVQGMAALAASLLCYYDEERCFVMLVRLWKHRGLARLYQPGFAGLMIALQDLEKHWLKGKQVSEKLNELGIDPTAYGTRWYLTLFNLSVPFPAQLRVWDVFMLLGGISVPSLAGNARDKDKAKEPEDEETVFNGLDIIHATAAALIDMHKDVIIGGDFENVMKGLTTFQDIKDEDRFMNLVRAEWNYHRGKKRS